MRAGSSRIRFDVTAGTMYLVMVGGASWNYQPGGSLPAERAGSFASIHDGIHGGPIQPRRSVQRRRNRARHSDLLEPIVRVHQRVDPPGSRRSCRQRLATARPCPVTAPRRSRLRPAIRGRLRSSTAEASCCSPEARRRSVERRWRTTRVEGGLHLPTLCGDHPVAGRQESVAAGFRRFRRVTSVVSNHLRVGGRTMREALMHPPPIGRPPT